MDVFISIDDEVGKQIKDCGFDWNTVLKAGLKVLLKRRAKKVENKKEADPRFKLFVDRFFAYYLKKTGNKYAGNVVEFVALKRFLELNSTLSVDDMGNAVVNCYEGTLDRDYLSITYVLKHFNRLSIGKKDKFANKN